MNSITLSFILNVKNTTFNFNLNMISNNILLILGKSGSGKTTLLKYIAGIIKVNINYLTINNILYSNSKTNFFLETHKRNISYVPQIPVLFPHISVRDNITIGIQNKYKYIDNNYLTSILNIKYLLNRSICNLSGGEKQRINIAQMLYTNPKIVLMDEPFSYQDFKTTLNIIKYIKLLSIKYKIFIIISLHNIELINLISNNIIIIEKGKIIKYLF
jgi:molybdate transport system ATP-binding protein